MARTPPIALRVVTAEDEGFLFAVYSATRMEELAATDWSDAQKGQFCRMQFTAQTAHYHQHYHTAEYYVIALAEVRVGRLFVVRWTREIRIMDIAILPAYRRQGIGVHLLLELQNEAALTGKCLSIHVERFNPALRLYEHLGFRMLGDEGVYLLMEWNPATGLR